LQAPSDFRFFEFYVQPFGPRRLSGFDRDLTGCLIERFGEETDYGSVGGPVYGCGGHPDVDYSIVRDGYPFFTRAGMNPDGQA
jgi:hypothetical protein